MPVPTCDHLKEDGVFCSSPALKGRKYCHFHLNLRARRLKAARARRRGQNPALNLPFPEDMHAVQISLAETMWAVADNRIDTKRAGLIAYMLQQAATNLIHTPGWEGQREAVPANRPLRALNYPGFEKRFGLPPNTDLDAEQLEEEGAPPLSPSFGDRVGANEAGCPTPPSFAEVGVFVEQPVGGPHLPSVGKCGISFESSIPTRLEPGCSPEPTTTSPDRVPIPEDELKKLNMTKWEKMEFFLYEGRFNYIDPNKERDLMLAWLREKRRLTKAQYLAAQNDPSEQPLDPLDGPEYTDTKNPPFGFCNTLQDEIEERAAEDEEAA